MSTFTLKTRNINSKSVVGNISIFVNSIIEDFNIIWNSSSQRDAILEIIQTHLEDMAADNKIEQWNVVCDGRNNKRCDIENKITHLDIEFKQLNCYNITTLKYVITE